MATSIPAEVDDLMGGLVADLVTTLGDDLVGAYLTGSAVSGDYLPGVSDVDLVVVTARPAASLDLDGLTAAHVAAVAESPEWTDRIEIVYVSRDALTSLRTTDEAIAVISPGEPFHLTGPLRDWLQNLYLLRASGRTLVGVPVREVVPPIEREAFLAAVAAYVRYLAAGAADWTGGRLAYAVVSACRAAATMRSREPCSKREGAEAARERWPADADLIDAAIRARTDSDEAAFRASAMRRRAVRFVAAVADELR